ncbi:phosphohydrolase [Bdellovibrio sp. ZAP7]|uniref:metallophosphoesterase family protein n=1 Tax=Bdellovibrio sp. ZAP7 TaxID=2231053 RepID=UPI001156EC1A|nr:metallophosphoesterase [Bdellovibrio sp. ZAP7]QDK43761.1 phosphohydrolase [Bdellovibrio sp. ZAP7]
MTKILLHLVFFVTLSSCAPFVDSPFSDKLLRPERNLNAQNVGQIGAVDSDGKIRLAVFADPHQNYKAIDKVTYGINQNEPFDFIAGLGDYTNSAYNLEYDSFIEAISRLNGISVMAIGNHDSIGAGPELFKKAFGPLNMYFDRGDYRFIFFNTNNLESPENFDSAWLKETATGASAPNNVFIFTHTPLRDPERFFGDDAANMDAVMTNSKVKVVFNGHNHVYQLGTDNGTITMQCGRSDSEYGAHWLIITIDTTSKQFCVKRMDTLEEDCSLSLKP